MRKGLVLALFAGIWVLSLGQRGPEAAPKKRGVKAAKAAKKAIPRGQWMKILQRLDKAEAQGKDQKGQMKLVLINKQGKRRLRKAIFFQKGTKRRLIQFKYPAADSGLTVLIKGKSIQLYLPRFRRIRRVAAHVKNQPFMGSDLSFDDMSTIAYSKSHTMLSAFKLANGEFQLVVKPKSGAYKKQVITLRKDGLLREIVFYDKSSGRAIKKMTRKDFRRVKKYLFPHKLVVRDLRTGHRTEVHMSKVSMDSGIPNKYFTRRYLKRELDL